jgi:hypothetical protein
VREIIRFRARSSRTLIIFLSEISLPLLGAAIFVAMDNFALGVLLREELSPQRFQRISAGAGAERS